MQTTEKNSERPFDQSKYGTRAFKPTLEGYHYKFSLLLPISVIRNGREEQVFRDDDFKELNKLFDEDFGGFTNFKVLEGEWIDPQKETIVNRHVRYEIYSRRHDKAIEYFKELKENLQIFKDEKAIIIEQAEVTFVPNVEPRIRRLLRKVKYLKAENKFLITTLNRLEHK